VHPESLKLTIIFNQMNISVIFCETAQQAHEAWQTAQPGTSIFLGTKHVGTRETQAYYDRVDAAVRRACYPKP
jgi:uncharacterized protein YbaP (TraB family)